MGRFNSFDHIFEPIRVGTMTLKNRIAFAPMVCCLTTVNGEVTGEFIRFIEMQARTGAALVTIGATPMDRIAGADEEGELDVTSDSCVSGLRRIAEAAHRYGAKISVELVHAGRRAKPELLQIPYALAPSVITIENIPGETQYSHKIKEMDKDDIETVISRYVDVVDRLQRCGFDMAMIHSAHGNLIAQFLSPFTNFRSDEYGGCIENRTRFLLEALQSIRKKVGGKINLDVRLSATEVLEGGLTLEDTRKIIKLIQPYVDMIDLSNGMLVPGVDFFTMPTYYTPHCNNIKYSAELKADPEICLPIAVVGSITSAEEAEEALKSGSADIVSMARALLVDEFMLRNAYVNKPDKTRPCLRCFQSCTEEASKGAPVRCAVNPVVGRESRYVEVFPALTKKKAVIVGGGPAGMMAAQTLSKRGHEVVLFEKEPRLGGLLQDISQLSFKGDLRRYTEWNIRTTMHCGAKVRLGTEATPELITAENPDVVFIAVGAELIKPAIPGIEYTVSVLDADSKRKQPGKRVIVCGGGFSGTECALDLAMQGHDVIVLDMIPVEEFAAGPGFIIRNHLKRLLVQNNVKCLGNIKVVSISENGLTVLREGQEEFLECDTVISAFGTAAKSKVVERLGFIVPETYIIGDCEAAGNLHKANHDAFNRAVEV